MSLNDVDDEIPTLNDIDEEEPSRLLIESDKGGVWRYQRVYITDYTYKLQWVRVG